MDIKKLINDVILKIRYCLQETTTYSMLRMEGDVIRDVSRMIRDARSWEDLLRIVKQLNIPLEKAILSYIKGNLDDESNVKRIRGELVSNGIYTDRQVTERRLRELGRVWEVGMVREMGLLRDIVETFNKYNPIDHDPEDILIRDAVFELTYIPHFPISLRNLFERISLSHEGFIHLNYNGDYKVMPNTIQLTKWGATSSSSIFGYMKLLNKIIKVTININFADTYVIRFQISKTEKIPQTISRAWEIFKKIRSSFPTIDKTWFYNSINMTNISSIISIPDFIDSSILRFVVTNSWSKIVGINETKAPSTDPLSVTIFVNGYSNIRIKVSHNINYHHRKGVYTINTDENTELQRLLDYKLYRKTPTNIFTKFTIFNADSIGEMTLIYTIITRLIQGYYIQKDKILETFRQYKIDHTPGNERIRAKNTIKDPEHKTFEFSDSEYSRTCSRISALHKITEEQSERLDNIVFPRTKSTTGVRYPSDGKNMAKYACYDEGDEKTNANYRVGIRKNIMSNQEEYPYVPCCYRNTGKDLKRGKNTMFEYYRIMKMPEYTFPTQYKLDSIIENDTPVNPGKYGMLPKKLTTLLRNTLNLPSDTILLRIGTSFDRSLISCYQAAIMPSNSKRASKDAFALISEKYYNMLSQELPFDNHKSSVKYYLNNRLDAYLFIYVLDHIYKVNTYVFAYDEASPIVVPNHLQTYHRFRFPERSILLLLQHTISSYPPVFRYEIIASQDKSIKTLFQSDNNDRMEKLFTTYYEQYTLKPESRKDQSSFQKYQFQDYPDTTEVIGQIRNSYGKTQQLLTSDGVLQEISPIPPLPSSIPLVKTMASSYTRNLEKSIRQAEQIVQATLFYYSVMTKDNPDMTPEKFLDTFTRVDTDISTYPTHFEEVSLNSESYKLENGTHYIRIPSTKTIRRLRYNLEITPEYTLRNLHHKSGEMIVRSKSTHMKLQSTNAYNSYISSYTSNEKELKTSKRCPSSSRSYADTLLTDQPENYQTETRWLHDDVKDNFEAVNTTFTIYNEDAVNAWEDSRVVLSLDYNPKHQWVDDKKENANIKISTYRI